MTHQIQVPCQTPIVDHPHETKLRRQVREFMMAFGQHIEPAPVVPPDHIVRLRVRLVLEEAIELAESAFRDEDSAMLLAQARAMLFTVVDGDPVDVDLPEFADALADLDYVVEGARLTFGIDGEPIADEVHRSNMSKLGEDGHPVLNDHGKVTKGPSFSPPDVAGILRSQGWVQQ